MSWKGIQKSMARAPQSFRQKLNMGTITKDAVYMDAERRFKELEDETKKLHEESKKYSTAVNGMLNHQIEFSKAVEEIYKPISGRLSDPNSTKPEGNPEGIQACEQYREVVMELQETLKPELDMIETRIVAPADELLQVIKLIRKMAVKRDHKQLDLDRHTNSLSRIEGKKEKSANDEKKLYQAENNVEIAKEEFNYYNDMLKEELPKLFELEAQFIKPLFETLYYMQLNIFYTLYSRMEEMKIPYFDMTGDIEESFRNKRGDIQERTEEIGITHFRVGHAKSKLDITRKKFNRDASGGTTAGPTTASTTAGSTSSAVPPPAYQASDGVQPGIDGQLTGYGQPAGYGQQTGYGQPGQPAYSQPTTYGQVQPTQPTQPAYVPPTQPTQPGYVPPTQPNQSAYTSPTQPAYTPPTQPTSQYPNEKATYIPPTEYCTALYSFAPQAAGDLAIEPGDRIEIIQRTADVNGWWTGRLNGKEGVFPGNYVQLG